MFLTVGANSRTPQYVRRCSCFLFFSPGWVANGDSHVSLGLTPGPVAGGGSGSGAGSGFRLQLPGSAFGDRRGNPLGYTCGSGVATAASSFVRVTEEDLPVSFVDRPPDVGGERTSQPRCRIVGHARGDLPKPPTEHQRIARLICRCDSHRC